MGIEADGRMLPFVVPVGERAPYPDGNQDVQQLALIIDRFCSQISASDAQLIVHDVLRLDMSRPTIVKLIDDGEIPAHVPGSTRRKLLLADVLTYRERIYARHSSFIASTSDEHDDQDEEIAAGILANLPADL